jgi:hypothetical protein
VELSSRRPIAASCPGTVSCGACATRSPVKLSPSPARSHSWAMRAGASRSRCAS